MHRQATSNPSLEDWYWRLLDCGDQVAREELLARVRSSAPGMVTELERMLAAQADVGEFLELDRKGSSES